MPSQLTSISIEYYTSPFLFSISTSILALPSSAYTHLYLSISYLSDLYLIYLCLKPESLGRCSPFLADEFTSHPADPSGKVDVVPPPQLVLLFDLLVHGVNCLFTGFKLFLNI